jgi:beta-galactosidase/beta-glucuronidase
MTIPRPEYPRPQCVRNAWMNLNGIWRFCYDDANRGLEERWYNAHKFDRTIRVPFAYQSHLSGIAETDFHDVVWYERDFELPENWAGKRILLHFGAVDYQAQVWVNGIFVCQHTGGHVPFCADITHALQQGLNRVTLRAEDVTADLEQPRGKQYWQRESASIFYTRTTGIWQTVWLEPVHSTHIDSFKFIPDIDQSQLTIHCKVSHPIPNLVLELRVSFNKELIAEHVLPVEAVRMSLTVPIAPLHLWSPETPHLYDVNLRLLCHADVIDSVESYAGMRRIAVDNRQITLNHQPYYMRLVLDQGYHPKGLLTFPSDDDIRRDVELTKEMGFNGVRKHQKVEDPRYLYWADRLGLLVWGEMANAYQYSEKSVKRITQEWQEVIDRDFNHPCIIAWVPINESWGVPNLKDDPRQTQHLLALYHMTHSLDGTRLVISNDGWEHALTDVLTIHDYEGQGSVLRKRYATVESVLASRPADRDLYVAGCGYRGEPILVTEFGGIAYQKSSQNGWGYTTALAEDDFIQRYRDVVEAVLASPIVQGFCYTQLTDVEQEINGLLTYDRQPKVNLAVIRGITQGKPAHVSFGHTSGKNI